MLCDMSMNSICISIHPSIRQSIRLSIISIYIYIHINIYINININIIQYLSISISLFMICFTISPASWLQNLHALLGFGDDIAEIPILQFLQGTNLHQTCFLSVKSERKKNMTISEFIFGISWWFRGIHPQFNSSIFFQWPWLRIRFIGGTYHI